MVSETLRYRALCAQSEYLKLIAANVVNRFGDSIDAIAISWLMYEITQSAALMALILGLNYLPTILLQPFTGALVERMSKKRVMIVFDLARGAVVLAGMLLYETGALTPMLLTAMMLLISTLEAFRSPAGTAIVPKLLPEPMYKIGTALNQTASRVTELIGLALAGGVIALFGCGGALLIDAATFFLSAGIIGLIRVYEERSSKAPGVGAAMHDFREGFRLIRSSKALLSLLLIGALMNFMFVPLNTYAVPFIADYLDGGAEMLSVIQLVLVGFLGVGSVTAPHIRRFSGKTQLIVFGLLQGAALCLFAAGGTLPLPALRIALVVFSCAMLGFGAGVINVVYSAAFLRLVPADFMARLSGLSTAILVSSLPAGNFLCSALVTFLPVASAILASGLLSIALYLLLIRVESLKAL